MKSILLVKKFLGLVEMTSGLVNVSFSLPELQAVKMIFFAPWVNCHKSLKQRTKSESTRGAEPVISHGTGQLNTLPTEK